MRKNITFYEYMSPARRIRLTETSHGFPLLFRSRKPSAEPINAKNEDKRFPRMVLGGSRSLSLVPLLDGIFNRDIPEIRKLLLERVVFLLQRLMRSFQLE